jgi:hypothetical protein
VSEQSIAGSFVVREKKERGKDNMCRVYDINGPFTERLAAANYSPNLNDGPSKRQLSKWQSF